MVSLIMNRSAQACNVLHHCLASNLAKENSYEWESEQLQPFNEALISWNALRPEVGNYNIFVSVKISEWTPWLRYATWSSESQRTYSLETEDKCVKVFQDTLDIKNPHQGNRIRIKIEATEGASLKEFKAFHLSLTEMGMLSSVSAPETIPNFNLKVSGISQMALPHPRHRHLCSPTSTSALIRALAPDCNLNPVEFADRVLDEGHDIYGNWVFNTAQAYAELKARFWIWVQRMNNLDEIFKSLACGIPVVVSIKGPLKGSPLHYESGHLMLVYGFDSSNAKVFCMDPAYPSDKETFAEYDIQDFLEAWNRRGRVAYMACGAFQS